MAEREASATRDKEKVRGTMLDSVTFMGIVPKEKQLAAVSSFVQGRDIFVALPTGYGKSLIYELLPHVFDKLKGCACDLAVQELRLLQELQVALLSVSVSLLH